MNIKKKLGNRIREIRIEHKLTQEALAERLNLSAKTLSQIEVGNNFISSSTLEKLCLELKISPKVLFDFETFHKSDTKPLEEINRRLQNNPYLLETIYKIILALD